MTQPRPIQAIDLSAVAAVTPLPHPLTPYDDLIVNVCPTGPLLTKAVTPHVPIQPEEVIDDVCRSLELGASMVHLHARDRRGRPTYRAEVYEAMILGIRRHFPDAVIGVTCIGNDFPELEKRAEVLELDGAARPDLASLALTTFDLPSGPNPNPPEVVTALAERMRARGIKPELECFDVGMVATVAQLVRKGLLEPPFYVNLLLGGRYTCPATARHLSLMVDDLPPGTVWAAAGMGQRQLSMNTLAIAMGGHCRVGLEDSMHWLPDSRELATNERLVKRVVEIARIFGRTPAGRSRVRAMLGLRAA
ncbi:MAG TPA: 3-keto-5-aminohexanoate cleavage protein [Gemmatimonadota bacterium]|jgi:uncharacterized protein (DUF849 family)